ncbi:MAG: hypothetical protein JO334_13385 [Verrucomicrobia bacterium]|nr:hypothetical protein [Verrucomicrobiota bacterium]
MKPALTPLRLVSMSACREEGRQVAQDLVDAVHQAVLLFERHTRQH